LPTDFQIHYFTEVRPVEAVLIHVGSHTGMTKLLGAFRDYLNTPENWLLFSLCTSFCWRCIP